MNGRHQAGMVVGRALVGLGRRFKPLVPQRARQWMDDRFFGAVFQITRVTNDNYDTGTTAESSQSG